jgi:hypothetical protein
MRIYISTGPHKLSILRSAVPVPCSKAEPLDKNRRRIFQRTLGFLSAIRQKYGIVSEGTLKFLRDKFLIIRSGKPFQNVQKLSEDFHKHAPFICHFSVFSLVISPRLCPQGAPHRAVSPRLCWVPGPEIQGSLPYECQMRLGYMGRCVKLPVHVFVLLIALRFLGRSVIPCNLVQPCAIQAYTPSNINSWEPKTCGVPLRRGLAGKSRANPVMGATGMASERMWIESCESVWGILDPPTGLESGPVLKCSEPLSTEADPQRLQGSFVSLRALLAPPWGHGRALKI